MASRYFGLNRGQVQTDIVEQSSSPSKDLEVKLDLTKNMTRDEVYRALDEIKKKMMQDAWPPA